METFSVLLALCARNSPVTDEFPSQRQVTRNFDVFFDLRLNKRFSKQSRCRWFETPSHSLWRLCNACTWFALCCVLFWLLKYPWILSYPSELFYWYVFYCPCGPVTRYVKLLVAHAPGSRERLPRHSGLAIPTCITARAWRTCRDACRDR